MVGKVITFTKSEITEISPIIFDNNGKTAIWVAIVETTISLKPNFSGKNFKKLLTLSLKLINPYVAKKDN